MNSCEYDKLQNIGDVPISADLLVNKSPRTLLYGYTLERDTWHVYLDIDGEIQTIKYGYGDNSHIEKINISCNEEYIPTKRLYAERCDFEFCSLLKQHGVTLNFTTPNFEAVFGDQYHGRLISYENGLGVICE